MVDTASGGRATPYQRHRGHGRSIFSGWPHRLHERNGRLRCRQGRREPAEAGLRDGRCLYANVSPDGQTISITMAQYDTGFPSLVEVAANAAGFRTAYPAVTGGGVWSSDGRYLLYPDSSSDIWA